MKTYNKKLLILISPPCCCSCCCPGSPTLQRAALPKKTLFDQQRTIVAQAAATTDLWLRQQKKVIDSVRQELEGSDLSNADLALNILRQALNAGEFSDIYIGLNNGLIIDGTGWVRPLAMTRANAPGTSTGSGQRTSPSPLPIST